MDLIDRLGARWAGAQTPVLIRDGAALDFGAIREGAGVDLSTVAPGDVVALIGDFDPVSIATLLRLIDRAAIIVPLTRETATQHEAFFEAAGVDVVIEGDRLTRRRAQWFDHPLLGTLRKRGHPGLVLFSSGTTGTPKAILHDFTVFLERFETPRPTLRTLNFLLFDHIGGINTLLHTLFNTGTVIATTDRSVDGVLETIARHDVELLPTTPTYLRMMLIAGAIPQRIPACLRIITYGTERMDQPTLNRLCQLLPHVDFRQTFGMSELGILRVKSVARDSLFMTVGGEGVETRIVDEVLQIRSKSRMLGYLNAPSPFDADGWYDTKDVVITDGAALQVVGRKGDVINVGGLKFLATDVEAAALAVPGVNFARATAAPNPITGQHVELTAEIDEAVLTLKDLQRRLKAALPRHMRPARLHAGPVAVNHRFKKSA